MIKVAGNIHTDIMCNEYKRLGKYLSILRKRASYIIWIIILLTFFWVKNFVIHSKLALILKGILSSLIFSFVLIFIISLSGIMFLLSCRIITHPKLGAIKPHFGIICILFLTAIVFLEIFPKVYSSFQVIYKYASDVFWELMKSPMILYAFNDNKLLQIDPMKGLLAFLILLFLLFVLAGVILTFIGSLLSQVISGLKRILILYWSLALIFLVILGDTSFSYLVLFSVFMLIFINEYMLKTRFEFDSVILRIIKDKCNSMFSQIAKMIYPTAVRNKFIKGIFSFLGKLFFATAFLSFLILAELITDLINDIFNINLSFYSLILGLIIIPLCLIKGQRIESDFLLRFADSLLACGFSMFLPMLSIMAMMIFMETIGKYILIIVLSAFALSIGLKIGVTK